MAFGYIKNYSYKANKQSFAMKLITILIGLPHDISVHVAPDERKGEGHHKWRPTLIRQYAFVLLQINTFKQIKYLSQLQVLPFDYVIYPVFVSMNVVNHFLFLYCFSLCETWTIVGYS